MESSSHDELDAADRPAQEARPRFRRVRSSLQRERAPKGSAGILSGALRRSLDLGVLQTFGRMVAEGGRQADAIGAIGLGLGLRVQGNLLVDPESGEPLNEEAVLRHAIGDASLAGRLIYLNDRARLPLVGIARWLQSIGL